MKPGQSVTLNGVERLLLVNGGNNLVIILTIVKPLMKMFVAMSIVLSTPTTDVTH